MSAGSWLVAGAAAFLALCVAFGYAVRRLTRNPGQRADRLARMADPRPTAAELIRGEPPDRPYRHLRPAPPVWPDQVSDEPPSDPAA